MENSSDPEKTRIYICPHCNKSLEVESDDPICPKENLWATRNISNELRYQILSEQKWKCNECGVRLKFNKHNNWEGEVAHIDHIHPFADRDTYKGYINERQNLQALCFLCNSQKRRSKG